MPNNSLPQNAHGAQIWFEADEPVVIGTFTRLTGVIDVVQGAQVDTPANEHTPHNLNVAAYNFSSINRFPAFDVNLNHNALDTTHQKMKVHSYSKVLFGIKFIGVQNSGTMDTFVVSGAITNWNEGNPADDSRTAKFTFQPSGPYYVDGTLYQ